MDQYWTGRGPISKLIGGLWQTHGSPIYKRKKINPRVAHERALEMWWYLTDDGLQRPTQSRGETSSSLADDRSDDGGSL